jgi:hypothetical protein
MRDYARIENDIVVELLQLDDAVDIATAFHPSLQFIEVTGVSGAAIGWVVSGNTVVPPGPPPAPSKTELLAYNANARFARASGGVSIAGLPYFSDPTARNTIGSAHDYAVANPGHITDWKLADGTFTQLNEVQLAHALQQMATFVQSCFTCESNNQAAINGGSMTSYAQINAAFAAISNVLT